MEKSDYPMLTKEMIAEVLLYITDPTYGELSSIFNGTTTIDVTGNPLICFSMGALLEGSEQRLQAVENNLNTYIWSIVLQRKFQVLLSFDELYLYLEQPLIAYSKLATGNTTWKSGPCLSRPPCSVTRAVCDGSTTVRFADHAGVGG